MSQVNAVSAKKTTILSAFASFAGMMAAIPVSLAIFSAAQPAQAMPQPQQPDSYAQYARAYTEGYLSSLDKGDQATPVNCEESRTAKTDAPQATAASYHKKHIPAKYHAHQKKMMSPKELKKNITNSYNTHVSNVYNKTEISNKNINSNNTVASNNTTSSSVTVKDSDGAVVSNSTATNGSNHSITDVDNVASNNTVVVNDSFNKDSHDKTVIVKDSGNTTTTTTNNTAIINDSFNHENKVNVNSNNKVKNEANVYVKHEELHL